MALISVDEHGDPDGVWRVEEHPTGLRVYRRRALVLERASMDQVVRYLLERGVDVDQLVER